MPSHLHILTAQEHLSDLRRTAEEHQRASRRARKAERARRARAGAARRGLKILRPAI